MFQISQLWLVPWPSLPHPLLPTLNLPQEVGQRFWIRYNVVCWLYVDYIIETKIIESSSLWTGHDPFPVLLFHNTRKKAAYRPLFSRPCGQLVGLQGHQGLPFGHQGPPYLHQGPFLFGSPRSSFWVTKVLPTFTKVFPRSLRSFLWVTKVFPFGSPRSSLSLWVTKVFLLGHQGLPFCRQGLTFGPLRSSLWVIKVSPLGHQVLPFGSPRSSITINTNNTVNTINSF